MMHISLHESCSGQSRERQVSWEGGGGRSSFQSLTVEVAFDNTYDYAVNGAQTSMRFRAFSLEGLVVKIILSGRQTVLVCLDLLFLAVQSFHKGSIPSQASLTLQMSCSPFEIPSPFLWLIFHYLSRLS